MEIHLETVVSIPNSYCNSNIFWIWLTEFNCLEHLVHSFAIIGWPAWGVKTSIKETISLLSTAGMSWCNTYCFIIWSSCTSCPWPNSALSFCVAFIFLKAYTKKKKGFYLSKELFRKKLRNEACFHWHKSLTWASVRSGMMAGYSRAG